MSNPQSQDSIMDSYVSFMQKRPKAIITVILLITALFLIPLMKIDVDTSPKLFIPESLLAPLEKLESTIHPEFHWMYIIGKNNESMLSLPALKEQIRVIRFLHDSFDIDTESVAEIIDAELKEEYNKSILQIKSDEELNNAIYTLFEKSPDKFKSVAQMLLVKNYSLSNLEKYSLLKELYSILPLTSLLAPNHADLPLTEMAFIKVTTKDRNLSDDSLKKTSVMIRESVDSLNLKHIKVLHYSHLLLSYDIDQKIKGNTTILAVLTLVLMSASIFIGFRRAYFVFIPLFIIFIAFIWTFGTAVMLDLKITALHMFIIALLIGIALDGPLHITIRLLEKKTDNSLRHSSKTAFVSMLPAFFLTFITTVAAFSAQLILPLPPALFSFALVILIGVAYSFLLVCLLWPALIILRRHPSVPGIGNKVKQLMNWVFKLDMKHPKLIIALLLILSLASIYNATKIETNTKVDMFAPEGLPTKEAIKVWDLYATEYVPQFILIEGNLLQPEILSALDKLENNVQDNEFFEQVNKKVRFESVNTLLREANITDTTDLKRAYDELYENTAIVDPVIKLTFADKAKLLIHKGEEDYDTLLVVFQIHNKKSENVKQSYDELSEDIEQSGLNDIPGIEIEMTGTAFTNARAEIFAKRAQIISSLLMLVFTFLILLLIYRNLTLSAIVLIPILLCSTFSLGLMPLLDIPLTWLNATVIPLIIGLGIDYSIYLTGRYKEELKKQDRKEAARIALEQTGKGNWLAMLTTIIGFIIISFSFLPMAKSFGILTAISMLLTFLTTILLLPILLVRFAKKY